MKKDTEITVFANQTEKTKKSNFFKSRGFKYGSLATALTAALIVVVIAANIVLSLLADTYAWAFDFTSTNLYKISDATKQVINSLDEDVEIEITIMYDETNYPHYIAEPIKRFCNLSDKINYKYIDPEKNPAILTSYGSEYHIKEGAVVIECGDRIRVFNTDDYFSYDQESGAMSIFIEERLAAGILFVTKDEIPVVYFLNGNGEEGYEPLMNVIANNGAEVKEINLMTDKVDFDVNSKLMVICAPTRDYSENEIRRLQDFLSNGNKFGRNLMYFSSTDAPSLPNLENMLKEWGIKFNNDIVLDSVKNVQSVASYVIPEFTTEEIMSTGAKISAVTLPILPESRSIELLFEENSLYKTQPLITSSSDSSYSRDVANISTSWDKAETDRSGPFVMSALSMKYKYINNVQVQSYIYASGSADMLSVLTYSGNGEFLMQLYKIMIDEQDETIVAAQKSSSSTIATISGTQMNVMAIVVLGVVPLLFLVVGLVVYIRRRFL